MSGAMLAVSPWLFGFSADAWLPHVVFGIVEIGAALTTRKLPGRSAGAPSPPRS